MAWRLLPLLLWLALLSPLPDGSAHAAGEEAVRLYFFWAKGCVHCLEEKKFLARLAEDLPFVQVVDLELTGSAANRELLQKVSRLLKVEMEAVPLTVVGRQSFVGWEAEAATGEAIRQAVLEARRRGWPDVVAPLAAQAPPAPAPLPAVTPQRLVLPLAGEIDLGRLSLGALTVLLGALDGFNPCAMWALVFLIGLLLGLEDRRKRWVLGAVFILGSGLVYFLFMAAWLNLFLFLGLVVWVRLGLGLVALGAGALNFRAFFRDRSGSCPMLGGEKRRSLLEKIRQAVERQGFWLSLGGVFLLGLAVNMVELICSAGLPVIYTQILALSNLPWWGYYGFLILYIIVFMLDDLVVFLVSMLTLEHLGLTHKYQRFSHIVGGLVLMAVGTLLLLKPEWLVFW